MRLDQLSDLTDEQVNELVNLFPKKQTILGIVRSNEKITVNGSDYSIEMDFQIDRATLGQKQFTIIEKDGSKAQVDRETLMNILDYLKYA